jgi:hypothetical protein
MRHQIQECWHILEENFHLKVHRRLFLMSLADILCVDPREEQFKEDGCASEGGFISIEDDVEEALHEVLIDQ